MFSIKGRAYKVEYEGLHLLCLNCGKFGHYVEGCPKTSVVGGNGGQGGDNDRVVKQTELVGGQVAAGPWTVVSKTRRPRKNPKLTEAVTGGANNQGSRFAISGEDNLHLEEQNKDTTINPEINANNNGAFLFIKNHVEMTSNDNARGLSNWKEN